LVSTDGYVPINGRRNIAKNFNRLSRAHEYVTDEQTDRRHDS